MSWFKLEVEVADVHVDSVADALLDLGASSASVAPAPDESVVVVQPYPGIVSLWQLCTVSALLPLDTDLTRVKRGLSGLNARVVDVGFLEDANWLERWRQHAVSACFGGRFWLLPRDAPPMNEPCLRVDPGLAFGTGGHPTTRLCLDWLAAQDLNGDRVLDYGCGSGVLGLAACVLGAAQVVAVDHDPQARDATRSNAEFNGLGPRVTIGDDAICNGDNYDVVVANILAGPLVVLAPRLVGLLQRGGRLALSGLLRHQAQAVIDAYPGVEFDSPRVDGEWICLAGRLQAA